MQNVLIISLSLHVLAAVFWAGSTFALARTNGSGGERLFVPQIAAGTVVILTGGHLWGTLHAGSSGPTAQFLQVGAICALIAFVVQATLSGPALRKARNNADDVALQDRIVNLHRITAALLAVATVSMAAARYA